MVATRTKQSADALSAGLVIGAAGMVVIDMQILIIPTNAAFWVGKKLV